MNQNFKLLKICVCNFYNYYGRNEIDLTTNSQNNIFLFDIENGGGKTSLFHAIKWGFYGENGHYSKNGIEKTTIDFMNDSADPSEGFYVEILFSYEGDTYLVKRTCSNPKSKKSEVTLNKDGVLYESPQSNIMLERIIPSNYGNFFMFDGDELANLAQAQDDSRMVEGVLQLLGLKEVKDLQENLERLYAKIKKERDVELAKENGSSEDQVNYEHYQNKVNETKDKLNKYIANLRETETLIAELKGQRDSCADVSGLLNEQKELEVQKNKIEISNERIKEELKTKSKDLFRVFLAPEIEYLVEENNKRISDLQGISNFSVEDSSIIEQRLKILNQHLEKCPVCQLSLNEADKILIQELIEEDRQRHERYKQYSKEIDSLVAENAAYEDSRPITFDYQFQINTYHENEIMIKDLERKLQENEKKLRESNYDLVSKLSEEIEIQAGEKARLQKIIEDEKRNLSVFERKMKELAAKLLASGNSSRLSAVLNRQCVLIERIVNSLRKSIVAGTRLKRQKILELSNEVFLKMTNKTSIFAGLRYINETSYSFETVKKNGKVASNPSNGELQVRAMSFLIALTRCSERKTPIMMDTPLSRLDQVHATNLGDALSELDNQVLFLAQPAELATSSVKENLLKSTAKIFKGKVDENNWGHIEEVKEI